MSRAIITTYYSDGIYRNLWEKYYGPFFDYMDFFQYPIELWRDNFGIQCINTQIKPLLEKHEISNDGRSG